MATLMSILEAARTLSRAEREQLRALLDSMSDDPTSTVTEQTFAQSLKQLHILDGPLPSGQRASFHPAPTRGKAASDIIIDERR